MMAKDGPMEMRYKPIQDATCRKSTSFTVVSA